MIPHPPPSTLFPYTTLFRSLRAPPLRECFVIGWAMPGIDAGRPALIADVRSEEHTSELQSRRDLVCRLLLEKKNSHITIYAYYDDRGLFCPESVMMLNNIIC